MTGERVAAVASAIGLVLQPVFLAYFLLYNGYMLLLILLSARQVRRRVAGHFVEDLDLIDDSDYTTVGGFLFGQLGRLPKVGDRVTIGRHGFEIAEMAGRRVERVRVILTA